MSAVTNPAGRRPSRLGAMANLGMVLAIVAVILPLALHASQPPPPTVAEFAPAAQQIKQPPKEQAGLVGNQGGSGKAGGGARAGGPTSSPTPAPPTPSAPAVIDTKSVHHCVGDPPRQIEDPQSPPCIPYWQGDNHGATSKGVDANSIKIFVWHTNWSDNNNYTWEHDLESFFNNRFEFYGRHIKLILAAQSPQPTSCAQDLPQTDQQHAAYVISLGVFASTAICDAGGPELSYYTALRNAGIISTVHGTTAAGEGDYYSQMDPYVWSITPGLDIVERNMAEYACRALVGKPARFAGDPLLAGAKRKFALAYTTFDHIGPAYSTLLDQLSACGAPISSQDVVEVPEESQSTYPTTIAKLKTDNINNVLCLCESGTMGYLQHQAESQGYEPEWYVSSFLYMDDEVHAEVLWPASEASHTFGISFMNKELPLSQTPWYWGCKEVDPSGCNDGVTTAEATQVFYSNLLMLASGIQMAGPNLNPDTFKKGLVTTQFPDPASGAPPYFQAGVSFAPDHAFNQDATLFWFDPKQTSVENPYPGSFCYANGGRRYSLGNWPATDSMLYQGTCH